MTPAEKIISFAERFIALRNAFREDSVTLTDQAKEAEVDMPALRRLVAYMSKDDMERQVQEAIDDQYRFLAGLAAAPAELPAESQLAAAAALCADKMTIRAVAKEMGISVGKAHQLKIKAAAFNVHVDVNVNKIDPTTGEVIQEPRSPEVVRSDCTQPDEPPREDGWAGERGHSATGNPAMEGEEDDFVLNRTSAQFGTPSILRSSHAGNPSVRSVDDGNGDLVSDDGRRAATHGRSSGYDRGAVGSVHAAPAICGHGEGADSVGAAAGHLSRAASSGECDGGATESAPGDQLPPERAAVAGDIPPFLDRRRGRTVA